MRPTHDEYMLLIALATRLRSTCPRMSCGAVAVSYDGEIVGTGYNGAPHGQPHCTEVGCLLLPERDRDRCQRSIHAEENALRQAKGRCSVLYSTGQPCFKCTQRIMNERSVHRVLWLYPYADMERDHLLTQLHLTLKIEQFLITPDFMEYLNAFVVGFEL